MNSGIACLFVLETAEKKANAMNNDKIFGGFAAKLNKIAYLKAKGWVGGFKIFSYVQLVLWCLMNAVATLVTR